jgi:hypothetical protein
MEFIVRHDIVAVVVILLVIYLTYRMLK